MAETFLQVASSASVRERVAAPLSSAHVHTSIGAGPAPRLPSANPDVVDSSHSSSLAVSSVALAAMVAPAALKRQRRRKRVQQKAGAVVQFQPDKNGSVGHALQTQCEATGASYAMFWAEEDGGFVVREYYNTPEHTDRTYSKRRSQQTFASRCQAVKMKTHTLVAGVARCRTPVFIEDTRTSDVSKRASWFREFGIKSVCLIPLPNGVLEYGSDVTWSEPPSAIQRGRAPAAATPLQSLQDAVKTSYEAEGDRMDEIRNQYAAYFASAQAGSGGGLQGFEATEAASVLSAASDNPAPEPLTRAPAAPRYVDEEAVHFKAESDVFSMNFSDTLADWGGAVPAPGLGGGGAAATMALPLPEANYEHQPTANVDASTDPSNPFIDPLAGFTTEDSMISLMNRAESLVGNESDQNQSSGSELLQCATILASIGRHAASAELLRHLRDNAVGRDLAHGNISVADARLLSDEAAVELGLQLELAGMLPEALDALLEACAKPHQRRGAVRVEALASVSLKLSEWYVGNPEKQHEVLQAASDAEKLTCLLSGSKKEELEYALSQADFFMESKAKEADTCALQDAISKNTVQALEPAIDKARYGGVSMELIDVACAQLAAAKATLAAKDTLRRAIQANTIQALEMGIESARCHGVDEEMIADADMAFFELKRAEAKTCAADEIRIAMMSYTTDALKPAIAKAEAAGVEDAVLEKAKRAFAQLTASKERNTATAELRLAMELDTYEALEGPLARAEEAGVEHKIVEQASRQFATLGAAKVRNEVAGELKAAMAEGKTEILEPLIKKAKDVGVDGVRLDAARSALMYAQARRECVVELREAMYGGSVHVLEIAIERARVSGVEGEIMEKAYDAYAELAKQVGQNVHFPERRQPGQAHKQAAQALQPAIQEARAKGVNTMDLEHLSPSQDDITVGDQVQLRSDFRRCADAEDGPLAPGELGTITEIGDFERNGWWFKVNNWWYQADALQPIKKGQTGFRLGDRIRDRRNNRGAIVTGCSPDRTLLTVRYEGAYTEEHVPAAYIDFMQVGLDMRL